MKRIHSTIAAIPQRTPRRGERSLARARDLLLTPLAFGMAARLDVPGLAVRRKLMVEFARAFIRGRLPWRDAHDLIVDTFDSVRYFELDFVARHMAGGDVRVLDVSSPRALGLWLLLTGQARHVVFCNPHAADLQRTRALAEALGVADRCEFSSSDASALPGEPTGHEFGLVTSISVIEHIPDGEDAQAVRNMWARLRPGGRLLLSVPVAAVALEEYVDLDEYGLRGGRDGRWVFGQRFYDEALLAERVFDVIGPPTAQEVYGELEEGTFFRRRALRRSTPSYPCWAEPLHMARRYRKFDAVSSLPALGVTVMAFDRP